MIFIGIFSSPLPYLAIFFIYLLGMINYTYQAKGKNEEAHAQNKSIKIDQDRNQSFEEARINEKTFFYHSYFDDFDSDEIINTEFQNSSPPRIANKKYAVYDSHFKGSILNAGLFIRPPPSFM